MTSIAEELFGVGELPVPPLQFTKNLPGVFTDLVVGALSKPLPKNDPLSSYRYLRRRSEMLVEAHKQRPLVRLQDENLDHIGRIGNEMSCVTEEIAADSGQATVVIRGGDYLAEFVRSAQRIETDLHISVDPVPSNPNWRTRWGGKITTINAKRDSSGIHTVELVATAQREHLKNVLIASNPIFPPEIQLPKMWFLPANIRTGCAITLNIQLARLFFPFLNIPTNILNPGAWLDESPANFNPLAWPQQVAFVNPILDQSRLSLVAGAWTDFHSATVDLLKDAGCIARSYTFFTEDEDSPHPELEAIVGHDLAALARPTRNCVVHSFEDHSGYEGPTGTALDGVINLFASTLDDLITESVIRIDDNNDGETDPFVRKLLLVAPDPPWAVYREGMHSGIIESNYTQHKGSPKCIMTGSKSPRIVNDLQTFGIRYGLSKIAEAIAVFGQIPGTEGIENLYNGQLDNTAFAWMRFTDPRRALFNGDLSFQEKFAKGGGTAYTVSGILTIRQEHYKSRSFRSFKTSIRNAAPYIIHYDLPLADRVAFEQDKIFYVDQISAIKYQYDRQTPITYTVSIGDDSLDDDPFVQGIRALQAVYALVGAFLGEGTIFG